MATSAAKPVKKLVKKIPVKAKLVARALPMSAPKPQQNEVYIPLSKLRFDSDQPRTDYKAFDGRLGKESEAYIAELAQSIKTQSLIQAITVRNDPERKGCYVVVVGESRTRAHLYAGLKKIRAVVREDLNDPMARLLFQLAENINRKPLTDDDMAKAITKLLRGDPEKNIPGINQREIANRLGKSEGWVTRYIRYANEDNHRTWVASGIVDTVENLYRAMLLPKYIQLDILRRVDLPVGDEMHLRKPISRSFIDELNSRFKKESKASAEGQSASFGIPSGTYKSVAASAHTAQAGEYTLSEEDRAQILSRNFSGKHEKPDVKAVRIPAIHCRSTVASTINLINVLANDKTLSGSLLDVMIDMIIPGELAKDLAAKLAGTIVEDKDVPMTLQNHLSSLR